MTIKNRCAYYARAALLLAGCASAAAHAAPFDLTGPTANNVDVPDTSPIVLNFTVPDTGSISSVGVRLALNNSGDGGDGYWDNLYVQLSHAGVDVVIMDPQLDNVSRIGTLDATFSDGAIDLAAAAVVDGLTTGAFNPLQALSAFNGLPLDGLWTLTIWDDTHPNDGTDLSAFSIFGTAEVPPPPATPAKPVPTLSEWAIIGLGTVLALVVTVGFRRRLS